MKKITSILIGILFLTTLSLSAQEGDVKITLEKIYKSRDYLPNFVYGLTPLKDGKTYVKIEGNKIQAYDFKTGKRTKVIVSSAELIPEGDTIPISMYSFSFSPQETKILFATKTEPIYRHSSLNEYYIFDLKTRKLRALSQNGKQQVATFSPNDNKIGFVRDNNLFYVDLEMDMEVQVTTDGKKNAIINGTTDWVYEEEFGFIQGFHWSPNSMKIAYFRFDESKVKEYKFPTYGTLYPKQYTYKYPKAGEDNSIVEIYVYDLERRERIGRPMPIEYTEDNPEDLPRLPHQAKKKFSVKMDIGEETDIYIPRIQWTRNSDQLLIQWMNRLQNELKFLLANVHTGNTETIYHEKNKYYIDITDNLYFTKDGKYFMLTSEKSSFNHIHLYTMKGEEVRQITSGKWDVAEFLGYDEARKKVYYLSSESSPINREMYSIGIDGKGKKRLSNEVGTNSVQWNPSFTYYINTFSAADTPSVYSIHDAEGNLVRVLEDNQAFKEKLKELHFVPKEFFSFQTEDGINLNAWMIKPYNFDKNKEYPLLMYAYGGPGAQTVQDSWAYSQYFWFQHLAQNGFIIVSVDNRGTGARGEEFKKMTYRQLGKYETIDQIASAKYFGNLPYIDKERIGFFGWSFGGYLSSLCITKGADVFNAAIAVAPVTNWRYYDNIYTERYMRRPQDNAEGYDNNSPINFVEKLKGNYLLIHGTADDNVHFQNSMEMVMALTKANKKFDFMAYPNSNHGIYTGRNTRYHLFTKMTDFLFEHLK